MQTLMRGGARCASVLNRCIQRHPLHAEHHVTRSRAQTATVKQCTRCCGSAVQHRSGSDRSWLLLTCLCDCP
jgi:hypothetical protein